MSGAIIPRVDRSSITSDVVPPDAEVLEAVPHLESEDVDAFIEYARKR